MKNLQKMPPKLSEVNAFRASHGLEPLQAEKSSKKQQNANRQARAQANRDMKANRQITKRSK